MSEAEYKWEITREKARQIVKRELTGSTIQAITIYKLPCDLLIEFDKGLWLDLIPLSAQFESWNLKKKEGRHLVGLPGGKVTWFLKEDEC